MRVETVCSLNRSAAPTGWYQLGTNYVTAADLAVRYVWAACTAGFSYKLDEVRLRSALQTLIDKYYPVLTGRSGLTLLTAGFSQLQNDDKAEGLRDRFVADCTKTRKVCHISITATAASTSAQPSTTASSSWTSCQLLRMLLQLKSNPVKYWRRALLNN